MLLCRRGLLSRHGHLCWRGCGGLGRASGQGFGFIAFGQLGGGHGSASLGTRVVVLGREGAEKKAGQVTEDCGAAGRDEVGSQQSIKTLQGVVDSLSVLEVARAIEKLEGKILWAIQTR